MAEAHAAEVEEVDSEVAHVAEASEEDTTEDIITITIIITVVAFILEVPEDITAEAEVALAVL